MTLMPWQLVLIILVALAGCILATIQTDRIYTRHHRKSMIQREEMLTTRGLLLNTFERTILERERTLVRAEQTLRRRSKEVSAVLSREHEHFDTMVSTTELRNPAEIFKNDDTVEMPPVKEEEWLP